MSWRTNSAAKIGKREKNQGKNEDFSLKMFRQYENFVFLQSNYQAPPFFLEWIWPSEDGFLFIMHERSIKIPTFAS